MDTTPFVFDNNYKNTEQVRPYLPDFLSVKANIIAAGKYPYNDSFKGKIPGLATTNDKNENTAIYLLQTLADLDTIKARTEAVLASGGYRLTDRMPAEKERGTLIFTGFYMGGTGWREIPLAQVKRDERHGIAFRLPRQKTLAHLRIRTRIISVPTSMKRFTVETTTITATRFSGREYRAYFGCNLTDEEIEAALERDFCQIQSMVQQRDGLGTRTTHTETTAYTRTMTPKEQP